MSNTILILNGPNINMLGSREPAIYGTETIHDVESRCMKQAKLHGLTCDFRQTNHEGVLVDWIQESKDEVLGIIINPGAYTHTSIAIMDAISSINLPVIEVHISNVHQRESFRHNSFVSKVALGVLAGFGTYGYIMGIDALHNIQN